MENQIIHKRSQTFYLCYLLQYSILSLLKLLKIIIVFFLTIGIETLTSPFFPTLSRSTYRKIIFKKSLL